MAERTRPARAAARRRRLRRRALIGAAVVVAVGAGGGAAWAFTGNSGPRYRLASVTRGDVAETVDTVGTIRSANRASATFPVSGKVASVAVHVGQQVSAGQTLASLDTAALDQKVDDAASALAAAQQTLAGDQAIQDGTATSATGSTRTTQDDSATQLAGPTDPPHGPATATHPTAAGGTSPSDAVKAAQQDVKQAQQALLSAQKALDVALNALNRLTPLSATGGACAPSVTPAPRQVVAAADSSGVITVTADAGDTVSIADAQPARAGNTYTFSGLTAGQSYPVTIQGPDTVDANACDEAILAVVAAAEPAAEGTTSLTELASLLTAAQSQLQAAVGKLAATRAGSSGTAGGQSGSAGSANPSGKTSGGRPNRGTTAAPSAAGGSTKQYSGGPSGSQRSATRTVTAQQLAADQAAVDAASANLSMAKQNRAQAVLASPIAGTVAAVGLAAGSSAGSGSITVIGAGGHLVDTTVSLTDVDQVKVGQHATVTVDGVATPLTGTVTYLGVLGSGTGSSTSYPVTISLAGTGQQLFDGTGANVAITTSRVSNVLTVPTSAVHALGALRTVTVFDHDKATAVRVTVGAMGAARTEIRSGLSAGQQVVLADLSEPIPTGNGDSRGARRFTGGGFGGAGLGGLGGVGGRTGRGGR